MGMSGRHLMQGKSVARMDALGVGGRCVAEFSLGSVVT